MITYGLTDDAAFAVHTSRLAYPSAEATQTRM